MKVLQVQAEEVSQECQILVERLKLSLEIAIVLIDLVYLAKKFSRNI